MIATPDTSPIDVDARARREGITIQQLASVIPRSATA